MIRKNREAGSSGGTVVMTEGTIWRQMVLFILPIIFGSFFQQLYNTTDAIIMGRFVGKAALSSSHSITAQNGATVCRRRSIPPWRSASSAARC